MKKIFLLISAIFCLAANDVQAAKLPEITDHEKVTIYLFRGHGCSHCYDAIEYMHNNYSKYSDYIEFVSYEVWYNQANNNLMNIVASEMDDELKGVPYIVVGDYTMNGFGGTSSGDKIIEKALEAYEDDKYKDVVAKIISKTNSSAEGQTLEESANEEGITDNGEIEDTKNYDDGNSNTYGETSGGKYDSFIIAGILLVVIGGTAALIFSNRK